MKNQIMYLYTAMPVKINLWKLTVQETNWMTIRRQKSTDKVIITEKVDGCNVGVLRLKNKLYPITRKGYDVRTNPNKWIQMFANYVEDNKEKFLAILHDGERLCGEWMIKTHTVQYHLKTDPFIVFDIINNDKKRLKYDDFVYLTNNLFTRAGLLHIGEAVPTDVVMKMLGEGYHGAIDSPEGVVYRYETEDSYVCSGKFVSNPLVGKEENFKAEDDTAFNKVPRKYSKYIKYCI